MMQAILLFMLLCATTSQPSGDGLSKVDCGRDIKSCGECLQQPGCSWCADPPKESNNTSSEDKKMRRCAASFTNCMKVEDLSNSFNVTNGSQIFTSPSDIHLELRRRQPVNITIEYRQPEDYPVDLYVLLDLSQSMKDDKEKLTELGEKLANEMKKITKDFRLGFGSFVDKTVQPYAKAKLGKEEEKLKLVMTYGFKHHLSLTGDAETFTKSVRTTKVSTNVDAPEGSIEALVQAMKCTGQIGWRDASRKIIILATDAEYHLAGDGKLAGIIVPNDLECHLEPDGNGEYTYTWINKHDYPSIAQLNYVATMTTINTIFAVTLEKLLIYQKLANKVTGAVAAMLTNDSSNIVDVVKAEYAKITGSVALQDDKPANIDLKYFVKCNTAEYTPGSECKGIKKGDVVSFQVEVVLKNCGDTKYAFEIKPVGIKEQVNITVAALCDCLCRKEPNNHENNSMSCSTKGNLVCGTCDCQPQYGGDRCECKKGEDDSSSVARICRSPNNNAIDQDCNGKGVCECGRCQCKQGYSGEYCECNGFTCPGNPMCSGPDQGKCKCGNCKCEPGWSGDKCDCSLSTDTCRENPGGKPCSGNGDCSCGKCVCETTPKGRWSGQFCQVCPTCNDPQCKLYSRCAYCAAFKKSPEEGEDCSGCGDSQPSVLSELGSTQADETACNENDKENCNYRFTYNTKTNETRVSNKLECPVAAPLGIIAGSAVGFTILVGLLILIIWRILTFLHDKREYAKFLKEKENAQWSNDNNPLYKGPASNFQNPAYKG